MCLLFEPLAERFRAERHRLHADHLASEYRAKTGGRDRTVDEWKLRIDGIDDH